METSRCSAGRRGTGPRGDIAGGTLTGASERVHERTRLRPTRKRIDALRQSNRTAPGRRTTAVAHTHSTYECVVVVVADGHFVEISIDDNRSSAASEVTESGANERNALTQPELERTLSLRESHISLGSGQCPTLRFNYSTLALALSLYSFDS